MASACRESSSALKGFPRKDTNMFDRGNTLHTQKQSGPRQFSVSTLRAAPAQAGTGAPRGPAADSSRRA